MLDEPELPEHEVQEPEDVHEKGKPRHDLFKTRSVQDTFHDASFCHTPHVNLSGSSDRVRGVRCCQIGDGTNSTSRVKEEKKIR